MISKIYWTNIEFKYRLPKDGLKGGFVYAFTKADDARDALDLFLKEFDKRDFQIESIEFVSVYDFETEWETKKQKDHFTHLYQNATNTGNVVFDEFYSYQNDEI